MNASAEKRIGVIEPGERVFYIRDVKGQPIGCVAYRRDFDEDGMEYVAYGTSFLHPNDSFNRARARQIALGRMRAERVSVIPEDPSNALAAVLDAVYSDALTPSRARRALRDGLRERERRIPVLD